MNTDKRFLVFKEVFAKNISDAIKKERSGVIYSVQEAIDQDTPEETKDNSVGFGRIKKD